MQSTIRQRRHFEYNSLRLAGAMKADERVGDVAVYYKSINCNPQTLFDLLSICHIQFVPTFDTILTDRARLHYSLAAFLVKYFSVYCWCHALD